MSTIVGARRPTDLTPRQGTEGEAPGTIDTLGSAINTSYDELPVVQEHRTMVGYAELIHTLMENGAGGYTDYNNIVGSVFGDSYDEDRIWADVEKLRKQDPVKFGKLPKNREEYEYGLLSRDGRRERDKDIVSRGGAVAGFVGGMIGYFPDPLNLATLPLGGGKTVVQAGVRAAGINAGIEVLQIPETIVARDRLGEDSSAGYLAQRVGMSAAGGFALGSLLKGASNATSHVLTANWERLPAPLRERVVTANWEKLPADVRQRLSDGATISARDLAELTEKIVGRENMSIDERAALDIYRRDVEIDEGSPFRPGIAGDGANRVKLDEAITRLLQPVTRQPRPFAAPVRPDMSGAAGAGAGGAGSSGAGAPGAALKAKIRGVESGGNDAAKNPRSSATGRYQFTSGTWLAYYKRRFGAQGLTDAQILSKRGDGRLQETLMDDLTADNARFLRSVGEAETAGNLYLTHFAGQGGARKLFVADPGADAGAVLGKGVVDANPWMRGMTAGDVIAWAHKKMNEPAPRRAGARTELADDAGEAVWRDQLQRELDRLDAEADASAAARAADDPLGAALSQSERVLPPVENEWVRAASDDMVEVPTSARAPEAPAGLSDRELSLLPALREEVAGTARLSDIEGIAKRLEASADEVTRALEAIAARDRSIVRDKAGRFRRAPVDRGPIDAHKFLARAGGLADREGHELIERFGVDARTTRTDELTGKRVAGARRQSKMVPGAGPLVRDGGMTIDEAGEKLFAAGYLRGVDGGRPTTAETLAYLERGMEGPDTLRTMVPEDRMGDVDTYVAPETLADIRVEMGEWAQHQAIDLTPDDIDALAGMIARSEAEGFDAALTALADRKILDALNDARYEDGRYDSDLADFLDQRGYGADRGGRGAEPRDAGEGGGRAAADEDRWEPIGEDAWREWDEPGGVAAAAQADSILHDLDARFGESADGEAPRAGSFYLDENGDARNWADVADELAADAAELKAIKDCM